MAHNLFGERFMANRKPAWHGLGTVFTEPITAVEAVQQAGIDYRVFKTPVYTAVPQNGFIAEAQELVPVPDAYYITREPTPDDDQYRFFATCTDEYEVLDNVEIARAIDTLTDRWALETVGALGHGEQLFIVLDAGEIEIGKNGGELLHQYFVFTDSKNTSASAKFLFTPVRVVCQNTLIMGERAAKVNAQIDHRTGASHALQLRVDIIDRLEKAQQLNIDTLQAMASITITNEDAAKIISAAYPLPKRQPDARYTDNPKEINKLFGEGELAENLFAVANKAQAHFERVHEVMTARREFATELYETINTDYPDIARTPWAAYNAVVEAADYRNGRGLVEASALFGARSKEKAKAYNKAVAVMAKAA